MAIRQLLHDYALATWCGAEQRIRRLVPTAVRVARARLKYGIGPLQFSIFQLSRVPQARWHDYLVKKTFVDLQLMSVNAEPGRSITGNKLRMYQHCRDAGLPTIPVLCVVGDVDDAGDGSVEHVRDPDRLRELLASAPPRLFVKPLHGTHGAGAFIVSRDKAGLCFAGRRGMARDLFQYLTTNCAPRNAFIIQPLVRPHRGLSAVTPVDGLPTARLVTAMFPDGPRLVFACFKIPTGSAVTDNFHNGLGGNLLAAIDVASGTLAPARGSRRRDWPLMGQVDTHPDTGQQIAGLQLPLWKELKELALRGQRSIPGLRSIGWDMAIGADGPVIVEGNYKYDMQIVQMACQRGLKPEFMALMEDLRAAPDWHASAAQTA